LGRYVATRRATGSPADRGATFGTDLRVLELIATGAPLSETLDFLCRSIDEQADGLSAVYILSHDGTRLSLVAGPQLPDEWRDATRSYPATSTAGACGAAINRRKRVVVANIAGSPLFSPWHEAARASHLGSGWSTPFFGKDGAPLGTFDVFHHQTGTPDTKELALVARATSLACIALERRLIEDRLKQIADHIREVFWMSAADCSKVLYVSRGYETIWGASCESLYRDARSWLAAVHPEDRDRVTSVIERDRERGFQLEYRIIRPDGSSRWVWDRGFPIHDESGRLYRVVGIAEDITGRKAVEQRLRRSEQLLRLVLDAIPVGVAVAGPDGDILLNNPASERIWSGVIKSGVERYPKMKAWWHYTGNPIAPREWASVRAIENGQTSLDEVIDIEAFDGSRKVIQNSAVPIRDEDHTIVGAVIVNEDITTRKAAERALEGSARQMRVLATRLMHAQDEERHRIAQMLHETTAQDLAALKMLLARLSRTLPRLSREHRDVLNEAIEVTDRSMREVRTLSYLLHPPFLDEAGLLPAVRWYSDGFAQRSGISVRIDAPDNFPRLPPDVETTLFRIVQEALINIHRHANSATATIRLKLSGGVLVLEVEDRGSGMPAYIASAVQAGTGALGVGIAAIRERLKQLGGTLEIDSTDHGTLVRAVMPAPIDVP